MRIQVQILSLLIPLFLGTSLVQADTHEWNDGTGGVWGTFTKWTPAGVPAPGDTARFNLNLDYTVGLIHSRQARLLQVLGGDVVIESTGIFLEDKTLELEDAFISNLGELVIRRGNNDRGMMMSTSDDMTVRGTMTVADGAKLDNQTVVVDSGVGGSTGRLDVTGVGPSSVRSIWNATELTVGNLERGAVRVEDRGFVQINGPAVLGSGSGGIGEVVVNGQTPGGTASDFRVVETLTIGAAGTGLFHLQDGANAASGDVVFGDSAGGRGTATLENSSVGNAAFWSAGNMNIKRGDLTVNSGGSLRTTAATIGTDAPSSATVSGAGNGGSLGRWNANGLTTISSSVDATLDIEQGGLVETEEANVGQLAGGVGAHQHFQFQSFGRVALAPIGRSVSRRRFHGSRRPGASQPQHQFFRPHRRHCNHLRQQQHRHGTEQPTDRPEHRQIPHGGFFDFLRGTLNTRSYTGDLVNQEGTLSPYSLGFNDGSGAGMMTVDGNYTQQTGATLAIDINGDLCGINYDHLNITGNATLGGDLELTLLDNFVPEENDTFDVLAAATTLLGTFDNVASGERLTTTDGLGSFIVNYGASSPFSPNMVVLSDFFSATPDIPGDLNLDGIVDGLDLGILAGELRDGRPTLRRRTQRHRPRRRPRLGHPPRQLERASAQRRKCPRTCELGTVHPRSNLPSRDQTWSPGLPQRCVASRLGNTRFQSKREPPIQEKIEMCTRQHHRLQLSLAATLVGALLAYSAHAQNAAWVNPSGGFYEEASNWVPNAVPGASNDILINVGTAYNIGFLSDHTANSLSISNNLDLTFSSGGPGSVERTFTLADHATIDRASLTLGDLTQGRPLHLDIDGQLNLAGADLTVLNGAQLDHTAFVSGLEHDRGRRGCAQSGHRARNRTPRARPADGRAAATSTLAAAAARPR